MVIRNEQQWFVQNVKVNPRQFQHALVLGVTYVKQYGL